VQEEEKALGPSSALHLVAGEKGKGGKGGGPMPIAGVEKSLALHHREGKKKEGSLPKQASQSEGGGGGCWGGGGGGCWGGGFDRRRKKKIKTTTEEGKLLSFFLS